MKHNLRVFDLFARKWIIARVNGVPIRGVSRDFAEPIRECFRIAGFCTAIERCPQAK